MARPEPLFRTGFAAKLGYVSWFTIETFWEESGRAGLRADTRIFSPVTVAGLCVTIGRYMYLFKRLTAVSAGRFYRFEHIETYSSGKVIAK